MKKLTMIVRIMCGLSGGPISSSPNMKLPPALAWSAALFASCACLILSMLLLGVWWKALCTTSQQRKKPRGRRIVYRILPYPMQQSATLVNCDRNINQICLSNRIKIHILFLRAYA